jgi:uncharacterized SAM-binding protein YcdF (DUF218 family)
VAAAARAIAATDVTVVTSSWHERRARLLVRAALGDDVTLEVVTPPHSRPLRLVGRELACYLPSLAVVRIRARTARRSPGV